MRDGQKPDIPIDAVDPLGLPDRPQGPASSGCRRHRAARRRFAQAILGAAAALAVVAAIGGVAAASGSGEQDQEPSGAQKRCSEQFGFGAQPVPVAKSRDGRVELARVVWGWNDSIGCYLVLDDAALGVLRAAPQPRALPQRTSWHSLGCWARFGFGAQPVPVAKTVDGQVELARVVWGHHESIGCFLALDPAAVSVLRAAAGDDEPQRRIGGWAAMGDSYASGQGADDDAGYCAQSSIASGPTAWDLLTRDGWTVEFGVLVACGGARSSAFDQQWDVYTGGVEPGADVISFSFGGNDIGFSSVIEGCAGWGAFDGCEEDEEELRTRIDAQFDNWRDMYVKAALRLTAKGQVYVTGYPRLIAEDAPELRCVIPRAAMSKGSADLLGRVAVYLDDAIRGAVGAANAELSSIADPLNPGSAYGQRVHYISVLGPFTGHEVCSGAPIEYLHAVSKTEGRSFHPTNTGHRALGRLLKDRIEQTWPHNPAAAPAW